MAEPADTAAWAEQERAQRRAWLRLTPAQRLDWLWEAKQFALEVQRARREERRPGARGPVTTPAAHPRPSRPAEGSTKTVVLGAEWDQPLRTRLLDALRELGATSGDRRWGVGGSQEIERLEVSVEGQRVLIEAETYVGLTLTGPPHLVMRIQGRLANS